MPQSGTPLIFLYILFGGIILSIIIRYTTKFFGGFKPASDDIPTFWAKQNGLRVFKGINTMRYDDRFAANPSKTFFGAQDAMEINEEIFFAEGIIGKRHAWLYRITGRPPKGSGLGTFRNRNVTPEREQLVDVFTDDRTTTVTERVFYGWCIEIETKHIPQTVTVTKKFVKDNDVLETESASFEKLYDISNTNDSQVLQLLDPVLIELIQQSQCSAIEISDASVLLYFTLSEISLDALDAMLQNGVKIADQVDQNFPLGSYNNA